MKRWPSWIPLQFEKQVFSSKSQSVVEPFARWKSHWNCLVSLEENNQFCPCCGGISNKLEVLENTCFGASSTHAQVDWWDLENTVMFMRVVISRDADRMRATPIEMRRCCARQPRRRLSGIRTVCASIKTISKTCLRFALPESSRGEILDRPRMNQFAKFQKRKWSLLEKQPLNHSKLQEFLGSSTFL